MTDLQPPSLQPQWCLDRALASTRGMQGYYNANVRVDTATGPVLVRIPRERADEMDLRIWSEPDVIRAVAPYVASVPRLLHASSEPRFQIHEYVDGVQLNEVHPRGSRLPPQVPDRVADLFADLRRVPRRDLPALPASWPSEADSAAFARFVTAFSRGIHDSRRERYGEMLRALGVPVDPFAALDDPGDFTDRAFGLLHTDVHRQNIMLRADDVVFLDWELALWGDPVYEMAVHLHKMAYLDDEAHTLLALWQARCGTSANDLADLAWYAAHEKIKSAVVDSVRYSQEIVRAGTTPARRATLVDKLAGKLRAARTVWAAADPTSDDGAVTDDEVLHAVLRWSPDAGG